MVRSAGSNVYNYDNPVRRDVVNIGGPGDMTTIRFKTDNAGPWIMHWFVTFIYFLIFFFFAHLVSIATLTGIWNCEYLACFCLIMF